VYPSESLKLDEYKRIGMANNIKPKTSIVIGKDRGLRYNQFSDSDKVFMSSPVSDVYYNVYKITYSDGDTVQMDEYGYIDNLGMPIMLKDVLERRKEYGVKDNYGVEDYLN